MKKIKNKNSTQEWLPIDRILDDGIIISKNNFIKIIKVIPINYDLKTNLEKESILNSYKLFLKTCNFDIQILIQSKKENLSNQISKLKNLNKQNEKLKNAINNYILFIEEMNESNKSSTKMFYIILKTYIENKRKEDYNKLFINQNIISQTLNDQFFKVKETLSRCGNLVYDINSKQEVQNILKSFLNPNY